MKTEFIYATDKFLEIALRQAEKKLHLFVDREKCLPKFISHSVYKNNDKYEVTILVVY